MKNYTDADYHVVQDMVVKNQLPADFDQWGIVNKLNFPIAHLAANFGGLPENFDQWDIVDNGGRTVAHEAAKEGTLPKVFDPHWEAWDWTDNAGNPVAVVAYRAGTITEDEFDQIQEVFGYYDEN